MMKERPILFSAPMVRALLDGRKSMTRRVVRAPGHPLERDGQPPVYDGKVWRPAKVDYAGYIECPYGAPGDRLWVRETWDFRPMPNRVCLVGCKADDGVHAVIVPDNANPKVKRGWRPSIFMPRWASRITLEVTAVRVERVQEIIKTDDPILEGVRVTGMGQSIWSEFQKLWDSINAKRGYGWAVNPFVWVISFKRIEQAGRARE